MVWTIVSISIIGLFFYIRHLFISERKREKREELYDEDLASN